MHFLSILTTFLVGIRFRRDFFCQMVISVVRVSLAVFCIICELETANLIVLFLVLVFQYLHHMIKNVVTPWRRPNKLVMTHYTGMGTLISCDYVVSNFLSIVAPYINKSYYIAVRC